MSGLCGCTLDVVTGVTHTRERAKEWDRISKGEPATHPIAIVYDLLIVSNRYLMLKLEELFKESEFSEAKRKDFQYINEVINWAKYGLNVKRVMRYDKKRRGEGNYDEVCYSALVRLFEIMAHCDTATAKRAIEEWDTCLLHRICRHRYAHPLHNQNPRTGRFEGLRSEADLKVIKNRILREEDFQQVKNAAAVMIDNLLKNEPPPLPDPQNSNILGRRIDAAKSQGSTPRQDVRKPNDPESSGARDFATSNPFQALADDEEGSKLSQDGVHTPLLSNRDPPSYSSTMKTKNTMANRRGNSR
jgi:hypothetical protein